MRKRSDVLVLGAGPAGLGAAYRIARGDTASVHVVERGRAVGGNAGSFDLRGLHVDFGSHRLHPACAPEILEDIQGFLGDDLLDRPRHGRIRLKGRWIHFPLKPVDLALRLPPSFSFGVGKDVMGKLLPSRRSDEPESFASVLTAKLGRTVARDFYLPYARKIWGLAPTELSPIQARRRVSADSPLKLIKKVLGSVPPFKRKGAGRFFYPRRGFGQISEAYYRAALDAGAEVDLETTVTRLEVDDRRVGAVVVETAGAERRLTPDRVWSTIPITVLARSASPAAPDDVLEAAAAIDYRSMLLIYLVLDQERFSEYDAHYFPEERTRITRMSEPKNYGLSPEPVGQTVLCAELPCSMSDPEWSMSDEELRDLFLESLETTGLPVTASVAEVAVRRLPQAYPIYKHGYEHAFARLDEWVDSFENLLTFGRQGLFAHDNTHHALAMAYAAESCLGTDGAFDLERWAEYRRAFETHVVED